MDNLTPLDLTAEQAVLGRMFDDPEARVAPVNFREPEDCYDEHHEIISDSTCSLDGAPLDQTTVADQLSEPSELEGGDDPELLFALVEGYPIYFPRGMYPDLEKECKAEDRLLSAEVMQKKHTNGDLHVIEPAIGEAPQQASGGDQWRWKTIGDAYKERKPREYLVRGLLPLPSLSTFFGAPGSLKTMVVQDLACCVSEGRPWLAAQDGRISRAFRTKQAAVLWIDVDNGVDRLEDRFAALGKAHKVKADSPLYYVSFPNPPFEAARADSVKRVIDMATKCGAKLIVFDNLGTISGGADENSSQMVAVMSGLRRIAEETGAAVIVIHHANKRPSSRKGNALRGHSSIEGAVDLALLIERSEGKDKIVMKSTKSRDAQVEPFSALWTYENNGDKLVKGCFFGPGGQTDQQPSRAVQIKKRRAREYILNYMKDGANQSQLIEQVQTKAHVGRNTTLAAIKELENEKKIYHTGKGSPLLYYRSKKAGV